MADKVNDSTEIKNINISNYKINSYINDLDEYPNPLYATSIIHNNFPYTDDYYDDDSTIEVEYDQEDLTLYKTGATSSIPFDPFKTSACIVTCGGLCPGLNIVIKSLWHTLKEKYGVKEIYGIQNGYKGFYQYPPLYLSSSEIDNLHYYRGSFIGTSRGGFDKEKIMEKILFYNYDLVFIIGGDGTLKGANTIAEEFKRLKLKKCVVHIPKTVDNDIPLINYTFGCETAVATAARLISNFKGYLDSYQNSVGFVKVMGRECGFIATKAAYLSYAVDILLIPEEEWWIRGDRGVVSYIIKRIQQKKSCLVLVSEGAYQSCGDYYKYDDGLTDKSGNKILFNIIPSLISELNTQASKFNISPNIAQLDPTYCIRSNEVNDFDRNYCNTLAIEAAHSAMSGYNGVTIGIVRKSYVKIPLDMISSFKVRRIDTKGSMYTNTLHMTKQPKFHPEDDEEE